MKNKCAEATEAAEQTELDNLCSLIKRYIKRKNMEGCEEALKKAIGTYPDSPVPHNLYGILYEQQNKHTLAMKHFRAAYSLDPSYEPAGYNMDLSGKICTAAQMAFDEPGIKKHFNVILMRGL